MKKIIEIIEKLWATNRVFRFIALILPFTGIINPYWFVFLAVVYFVIAAFFATAITVVDKSKYISPDGGKWDDQERPPKPPIESRDDELSDPHTSCE